MQKTKMMQKREAESQKMQHDSAHRSTMFFGADDMQMDTSKITELKEYGMSGVGLTFEIDMDGVVRVSEIEPGGPSFYDADVYIGDVLFSIDGIGVKDRSRKQIAHLIVGPDGTKVTLGMARSLGDNVFKNVEVTLERRPAVKVTEQEFPDPINLGFTFVQMPDLSFYIRFIVHGSPAWHTGQFKVGDRVWKVNGHVVDQLRQRDVIRLLQSSPGKALQLHILRGVNQFHCSLDLTRDVLNSAFKETQLSSSMTVPGIGIIVKVDMQDKTAQIKHVTKDGPADQTQLLAEKDWLIAVNGKRVDSILMADGTNEKTAGGAASMQKLLSMLEGDDGSVVILDIAERDFEPDPDLLPFEPRVAVMRGSRERASALPQKKSRTLQPPLLAIESTDDIFDQKKLGLTLVMRNSGVFMGLEVHDLEPGGSAERSGLIEIGDVIVAVDGVSVNGRKPEEIVLMLDGPVDSTVALSVLRPNQPTIMVTLIRDVPSTAVLVAIPFVQPMVGYPYTDARLNKVEAQVSRVLPPKKATLEHRFGMEEFSHTPRG